VDYTPTTKQLALIAMVLEVDKELEPEVLTREIIKKEKGFTIRVIDQFMQIRSKELKRLRAVVTGTFKHIKLILSTIE
jgi:hypothetical protein